MTDPAQITLIAELIAEVRELKAEIAELANGRGRWLNADQAGSYIGGASRERIYDLASQGDIPVHRDGRRLLFRQADLDAYVTGRVAE